MNKEEVIYEINNSDKIFYVYGLIGYDKKPFYIGMGQKYRIFDHEYGVKLESNYKKKIILQENITINTLSYELYEFFEHREDAINLEKELIRHYGRKDINTGILTNRSSGGEFPTEFSDETKKQLSIIKKNFYKDNPEALRNRSIYVKQWVEDNPEKHKLMQDLATEAKQKPEVRERYRESTLAYMDQYPEEYAATKEKTNRTRRLPENRKANSDRLKEYFKSPEAKKKNSDAQKLAHEKKRLQIDKCIHLIEDNNLKEVLLPSRSKSIKIFKEFEVYLQTLI